MHASTAAGNNFQIIHATQNSAYVSIDTVTAASAGGAVEPAPPNWTKPTTNTAGSPRQSGKTTASIAFRDARTCNLIQLIQDADVPIPGPALIAWEGMDNSLRLCSAHRNSHEPLKNTQNTATVAPPCLLWHRRVHTHVATMVTEYVVHAPSSCMIVQNII